MKELSKVYNSHEHENSIYKKWEESGFFNPDVCVEKGVCEKDADTYTIVLPPPNITDKLHLGHVVMVAISDILVRYNRMNGKKALWIPGTDHAAIATQNVVEKKILKEGKKTRHDLGRKKFLEQVDEFVDITKNTIISQLKKSGASLDWSREAFTLDEQRRDAVKKMFIDMYNEGVIYRGHRIVNWCPRCQSTLADDEVEHKEQSAKLYTFKYDKNFPFNISTTRPETKLGDTAVAVNPDDKRYKEYVGQELDVNFCGMPLKLKIIADKNVDPDFGTGAIGVTPAHSMIDYEMAQKNKLEIKKVIDEEGKIIADINEFKGKAVAEVRKSIVAKLKDQDLIEKEEDIKNNLSTCYRCGATIEPLTSKQWFVGVDKKLKKLGGKSLKEKAIEIAKKGDIKFTPERFTKRYLDWMENLHDWCISRQIWFGHQIPVYYKKAKKPVKIVYYVHGTTTDNEKNKASGHYDVELSELGIQQSHDLKKIIKNEKFDVVFCSDLKRAVDTANIAFVGSKIIKDKRLRECDYGDLTQGDNKKVEAIEKEIINKSFPNGESYKDVEKRIQEFLEEVMEKYDGKKIAIVAHKAPQLAIEVLLNNKDWQQAINEDWRKKKAWQPGWKYESKELVYVGTEAPKGEGWIQDEDVLDTWFSSGMWTFSTLGWPKKTDDLKTYHPTQLLETGYEIITLWVSRMIMMSLFAVDEIPFENVYLHGMVLDAKGKKMSKSKGNGIDPIEMFEKYGTDATRMSLIVGNTPGNDMRMSEEKIAEFRNFTNKLWNIARFVLQNSEPSFAKAMVGKQEIVNSKQELTLSDQWILNKMKLLIKEVTFDIEEFRFSQAGEKLRDFTWNDFADWYLEISKFEKTESKNNLLNIILKDLLKLWHPFMPFVTEAIWSEINQDKMLLIEKWPDIKLYKNTNNNDFEIIKNIITTVRNIRAEYKIKPSQKIKAVIYAGKRVELIQSQQKLIESLRTGVEVEILESGDKLSNSAYVSVNSIEVYIPLEGLVDIKQEKERIQKRATELKKLIDNLDKKFDNKEFVRNAPKEVVQTEIAKMDGYKDEWKKLKDQLKRL